MLLAVTRFSPQRVNRRLPVCWWNPAAIEQVPFSSNDAVRLSKDIQKKQPACAKSEDWNSILVSFANYRVQDGHYAYGY